jgi:ubiquinone biosynthesis protein COQ9
MHENQVNKKLPYEKELDEEAIKIAAAKEASYQQALDNEAISSASAQGAIAPRGQREAIALLADERDRPALLEEQQIALREMSTSERCVPQRFAMAFIPSMCLPRR